jgi:hypothetical protein
MPPVASATPSTSRTSSSSAASSGGGSAPLVDSTISFGTTATSVPLLDSEKIWPNEFVKVSVST